MAKSRPLGTDMTIAWVVVLLVLLGMGGVGGVALIYSVISGTEASVN